MNHIQDCLRSGCGGKFQDINENVIRRIRRLAKANSMEEQCLICSDYHASYIYSQVIDMALERGFQRCFQRTKLTDLEVEELIWKGLPPKPNLQDNMETDRWLFNLVSIQVAVQIHDWRHRKTCFKSNQLDCWSVKPFLLLCS